MHTNRLAQERSPYLLQHAHNPVDWYPWGEEAFAKARNENKPIFLSIGYSTCHWCHVMERESFESETVAAVLNRYFVPVKVDREERPDVDRIYMTFVQATTGGGGWPMSVWLTPELKPFYGGTYFPPDSRYGRPGFMTILEHIAGVWAADREKIVQSSEEVTAQLAQMVSARASSAHLDERVVESCYLALRRSFDTRMGGFGTAPKFPRPAQYHFLHRYWRLEENDEAAEMSLLTLREMYKGGMYDQLGGGFHRYSVDARWFVPHFEKMLYDQAQLAIAYLEAYQITREPLYAQVARETFTYVLRDMTDAGGGFYSAEDADSVIDPADPKHKGEGAFYVFTAREIDEIVRQPEAAWFAYRYGVQPHGNVDEDPHAEFTNKNILYQAHTVEETAAHFAVGAADVERALAAAGAKLMAHRNQRVRPHLDDKVLTAWNGLMISAFAKGAQVLGETAYADAAVRAARFLLHTMRRDGVLLRCYRAGEAAIPGFLDDYAFLTQALIDLFETTFDAAWLEEAVALTTSMIERFEDREHGGFFSTEASDSALVLRIKDDYDGAEPSGNSIAIRNLLRLAALTGRRDFADAGERALEMFAGRLSTAAITLPYLAATYLETRHRQRQIVLCGDAGAMLAEVRTRFLPNTLTICLTDESRARLVEWMPALGGMQAAPGQAAAYVCENFTCQMPVHELDDFVQLLS